jgi:hypothetical protein
LDKGRGATSGNSGNVQFAEELNIATILLPSTNAAAVLQGVKTGSVLLKAVSSMVTSEALMKSQKETENIKVRTNEAIRRVTVTRIV